MQFVTTLYYFYSSFHCYWDTFRHCSEFFVVCFIVKYVTFLQFFFFLHDSDKFQTEMFAIQFYSACYRILWNKARKVIATHTSSKSLAIIFLTLIF